MKVEIIAVGNEVITGKTVNTNASYIAKQIQNIGLTPMYHTSVGDNKRHIQTALSIALQRAEVILFIGGLGPTEDDLTKEAVCEYLSKPLILYEDILEGIKNYFIKSKKVMPQSNIKQAYFPEDCEIIPNTNGTASGALIQYEKKYIVFLPGPPKELKPMVDEFIIPYLRCKGEGVYYTVDVKIFGLGESTLVEMIPDLLGESENLVVAPYVGNYEITIRIRSFGSTGEEAEQIAKKVENELKDRLGEYIIGYNDNKLEEAILKLLINKNYTLSTAESCTGGLLAGTLVNCSGISAYFKEGFITYSNEAKKKYLGVKAETLECYGAVSSQTAKEMAEGVKRATGSYIGLSTTGIAGPEGGTSTKPVGLVYIGVAIAEECHVYELNLQGNRQEIREKTVKNILYYLYKQLNK